ncbi:extracellular lipase, partial [Aureobasidium melanogenum]
TWNTGQLMSDSCGYIALSHSQSNPRIIVAFRGTYSIANTVVDLSTVPQEYIPYPGEPDSDVSKAGQKKPETPRCKNCTVHTGFYKSWKVASSAILPDLEAAVAAYPNYALTLVGHSLGGAVAALAGLELDSRGWNPTVTTFGEPRLGNAALNQ